MALEGNSATLAWTNRVSNQRPIDSWSVVLFGETGAARGTTIRRSVTEPTVTVNDLAPGRWEARITSVNDVGESARRDLDFTVVSPPSPPTAVTATPDGDDVVIAWRPPADDGGSDIAGYRIIFEGETFLFGPSRRNARLFDAGPGLFSFDVAVANAGAWSESVTVTARIVGPPSRPRNVSRTVDGQTVTVTWNDSSDDGGGTLTYEVVVGSLRQTVSGNSAVFTNVAVGRQDVKVRAINEAGRSSYRNGQAVQIERVELVPGPPRSVTATTSGQRVNVSWQAPADAGTSPVTSYEVTVAGVTQTVTGTSAVFDGVDRGGQAAIVRAISAAGRGPIASSNDVSVLRPFDPFNSVDSFVAQQYGDFLGRSPDQAGLAFWSNAVGPRGENVADVIEQFVRAPEFEHRRSLIRLYLAYFNRFPDSEGFDYWSEQLKNGNATLESISQFFATSDEFNATYGRLTDGQFVVLVYNNVLVRQPEQDGFVYWTGRIETGLNRGTMMTNFSESVEFQRISKPAVDVVTTYRGMLGRTPNPAELQLWIPIIATQPEAIESLIATIYTSSEYADRIQP